jgi:hypothetical protein
LDPLKLKILASPTLTGSVRGSERREKYDSNKQCATVEIAGGSRRKPELCESIPNGAILYLMPLVVTQRRYNY